MANGEMNIAAGMGGFHPFEKPTRMPSDKRSQLIKKCIDDVEENMGALCKGMGRYARHLATIRDCGDHLARMLLLYGERESLSQTTAIALRGMAYQISAVQDYRDTQIKRLEAAVIYPLSLYGPVCVSARQRLLPAFRARHAETLRQRSLERVIARNPTNTQHIAQAQIQLNEASAFVSHTEKALEEGIETFERKKMTDIKQILGNFIKAQIIFHARALQMYSECQSHLDALDVDADMEMIEHALNPCPCEQQLSPEKAPINTLMKRDSKRGSLIEKARISFSLPLKFGKKKDIPAKSEPQVPIYATAWYSGTEETKAGSRHDTPSTVRKSANDYTAAGPSPGTVQNLLLTSSTEPKKYAAKPLVPSCTTEATEAEAVDHAATMQDAQFYNDTVSLKRQMTSPVLSRQTRNVHATGLRKFTIATPITYEMSAAMRCDIDDTLPVTPGDSDANDDDEDCYEKQFQKHNL